MVCFLKLTLESRDGFWVSTCLGILSTKDTSSPVLDFRNSSLMVQHRLGDGGLVAVLIYVSHAHVGSAKISEQSVFCLRSVMTILKPFSSRLKSLKTVKPQDVFRMNICFCDIPCVSLRYTSTATPVLQCILSPLTISINHFYVAAQPTSHEVSTICAARPATSDYNEPLRWGRTRGLWKKSWLLI